MTRKQPGPVAGLFLGLGIIVSTILALRFNQALGPAMIGPVVLALVMLAVGTGWADPPFRKRAFGKSLILAASLLVACGLVAVADPGMVALILPVLGASLAVVGLLPTRKSKRQRDCA